MFQVEVLGEHTGKEDADDAFPDANDGGQRVSDEDRAQGRAEDDDQFSRLHEHQQVAVLH